jgi:hypothetical protein
LSLLKIADQQRSPKQPNENSPTRELSQNFANPRNFATSRNLPETQDDLSSLTPVDPTTWRLVLTPPTKRKKEKSPRRTRRNHSITFSKPAFHFHRSPSNNKRELLIRFCVKPKFPRIAFHSIRSISIALKMSYDRTKDLLLLIFSSVLVSSNPHTPNSPLKKAKSKDESAELDVEGII